MNFQKMQRPVTAALATVFLLSACVTAPDGTKQLDNKFMGALLGAAAGCAVGSAVDGKKGCLAGAVVGAAAGFMIAWHFESKKIKNAQEINAEYVRQNQLQPKNRVNLPRNDVMVAKFEPRITSAAPDAQGQKEVQITANTDLVGYGDRAPKVQQTYAIYDEHNKLVEQKTEDVASVDGAGRYQTTSKFKLPAEAQGKNYTVKTALVSNNQTVKENAYKVSVREDGQLLVQALAPTEV